MITGATGCGKSSTINALFGVETAKVGYGADPETQSISKYELDHLILWDSPGLGDGVEADVLHSKQIIDKITEVDDSGKALIDLVLVIVDGSSRDMGTTFELISQVILPHLAEHDRLLVAINQCDIAMKGDGWCREKSQPDPELVAFLDRKVDSVKRRIKESNNVDINPIFYSAKYRYNLAKLFSLIIANTPTEKRLVYADNLNRDPNTWKHNDQLEDYSNKIRHSFADTLGDMTKGAAAGGALGAALGSVIPVIGTAIGTAVGATVGAIWAGICSIFD